MEYDGGRQDKNVNQIFSALYAASVAIYRARARIVLAMDFEILILENSVSKEIQKLVSLEFFRFFSNFVQDESLVARTKRCS